jgi:predicted NUDIX family NTP pyrophosphohydrolase
MKKHSAGIVVYRQINDQPEVLLAHMGSPWWVKKDLGAWSIPKGLVEEGEEPLEAAKREFQEEFGLQVPKGDFTPLGQIQQNNNKVVTAWAIESDIDASKVRSNTFKVEWPPRSGKTQEFPEIDRAEWFTFPEAAKRLVPGQTGLLENLANTLHASFSVGQVPDPPQQGSLF